MAKDNRFQNIRALLIASLLLDPAIVFAEESDFKFEAATIDQTQSLPTTIQQNVETSAPAISIEPSNQVQFSIPPIILPGPAVQKKIKGQFQKIFVASPQLTPEGSNFLTPYGLRIEGECKKNLALADLEKIYRAAMIEGISCLDRLAPVGKEGQKNIQCFSDLFHDKKNPPKLFCGGWPFGKEILAVGSFPGSSKRHPYLWISPGLPAAAAKNQSELKGIIFHEMLHNCGYIHSEGVEIPYTCEDCCFTGDMDARRKKIACDICGGKYSKPQDLKYAADILEWSGPYSGARQYSLQRVSTVAREENSRMMFELVLNSLKASAPIRAKLQAIFLEKNKAKREKLIAGFKKTHAELSKNPFYDSVLNGL